MHGLFKLWDRMPIRRKLAVTVAFQSLALLFLTFSILFDLGRNWETDEVGEALQVRTSYLSSMLEPIIHGSIIAGQPLDSSVHQGVEAAFSAILKQDPQIHQITLYGRTVRRGHTE